MRKELLAKLIIKWSLIALGGALVLSGGKIPEVGTPDGTARIQQINQE